MWAPIVKPQGYFWTGAKKRVDKTSEKWYYDNKSGQ